MSAIASPDRSDECKGESADLSTHAHLRQQQPQQQHMFEELVARYASDSGELVTTRTVQDLGSGSFVETEWAVLVKIVAWALYFQMYLHDPATQIRRSGIFQRQIPGP